MNHQVFDATSGAVAHAHPPLVPGHQVHDLQVRTLQPVAHAGAEVILVHPEEQVPGGASTPAAILVMNSAMTSPFICGNSPRWRPRRLPSLPYFIRSSTPRYWGSKTHRGTAPPGMSPQQFQPRRHGWGWLSGSGPGRRRCRCVSGVNGCHLFCSRLCLSRADRAVNPCYRLTGARVQIARGGTWPAIALISPGRGRSSMQPFAANLALRRADCRDPCVVPGVMQPFAANPCFASDGIATVAPCGGISPTQSGLCAGTLSAASSHPNHNPFQARRTRRLIQPEVIFDLTRNPPPAAPAGLPATRRRRPPGGTSAGHRRPRRRQDPHHRLAQPLTCFSWGP